jgi:methylated-DNA-protein-cysteine methyltransferase-like protein
MVVNDIKRTHGSGSMREGKPLSTYELIWEAVRLVPRGKVATYGQIAAEAGFPGQARLVGYALHSLPPRSGVPWHRVINAQGKISFPTNSPAFKTQKELLRRDGVVSRVGKIDLEKYGFFRKARFR